MDFVRFEGIVFNRRLIFIIFYLYDLLGDGSLIVIKYEVMVYYCV